MLEGTLIEIFRGGQVLATVNPRWGGPRLGYILLGATALCLVYFGARRIPKSSRKWAWVALGWWSWPREESEADTVGDSLEQSDFESKTEMDGSDLGSDAMAWEQTISEQPVWESGAGRWLRPGYRYLHTLPEIQHPSAIWSRDSKSCVSPAFRYRESPDFIAAGDETVNLHSAWGSHPATNDEPFLRTAGLHSDNPRLESEKASPSPLWTTRYQADDHLFLRATGVSPDRVYEEVERLDRIMLTEESTSLKRLGHRDEPFPGCWCQLCQAWRRCAGSGDVWATSHAGGEQPFLRASGLEPNSVREEAVRVECTRRAEERCALLRLGHRGEPVAGCRCMVCVCWRKYVAEIEAERAMRFERENRPRIDGEGEGEGGRGGDVDGLLESLKGLMMFASP